MDESVLQGESPERHVARLAASKATSASLVRPTCVVIGADTTVALGGQMLGKPADAEGAAEALRRLSGRTHSVFTGVAVATSPDVCDVRVEKARVRFGELDPAEIDWYLAYR